MTTRRTFLTLLSSLPAGASGFAAFGQDIPVPAADPAQAPDGKPAEAPPGADAMDEALEMLRPYGPSFGGGLSNHGPMAAEAIVTLGLHEGLVGWVDAYRRRLERGPRSRRPIEAGQWRGALGEPGRLGDWEKLFAAELAEAPWGGVLARWVPRLAPGMAAAGFHGVIRVGHAACSLSVRENELRIDELARALAYWATEYLPLPGAFETAGQLSAPAALQKTPLLPRDQRTSRGLITTELKDLMDYGPYEDVVGLVDPTAGSPTFSADLLASFAGVFLNARSNTFEFLHAITGAAAATELLPYLDPEQRPAVMAYAWQVSAAMYSRYGDPSLLADPTVSSDPPAWDQLAGRAGATGDEHTMKLVAACARAWRRHRDPRLAAVAARRTS